MFVLRFSGSNQFRAQIASGVGSSFGENGEGTHPVADKNVEVESKARAGRMDVDTNGVGDSYVSDSDLSCRRKAPQDGIEMTVPSASDPARSPKSIINAAPSDPRSGSPQIFQLISPKDYIAVTDKERLNRSTLPIRVYLVRFKGDAKSDWVFPTSFPPSGTSEGSISYSAANISIPVGEAVLPHGHRSKRVMVQASSLGGPLFPALVATMSNTVDRISSKDNRVISVFAQHSAMLEEEILTYHLNVPDETGRTMSVFTGFLRSNIEMPYEYVSRENDLKAGILVIASNEGFPLALDRSTTHMGILGGKLSIPIGDYKEEAMETGRDKDESAECLEDKRQEAPVSEVLSQQTTGAKPIDTIGQPLVEFQAAPVRPIRHEITGASHPLAQGYAMNYDTGHDLSADFFNFGGTLPQEVQDHARVRQGSHLSTGRSDSDPYGSLSEADSTTRHFAQLGSRWGDTASPVPEQVLGGGSYPLPPMGQAYMNTPIHAPYVNTSANNRAALALQTQANMVGGLSNTYVSNVPPDPRMRIEPQIPSGPFHAYNTTNMHSNRQPLTGNQSTIQNAVASTPDWRSYVHPGYHPVNLHPPQFNDSKPLMSNSKRRAMASGKRRPRVEEEPRPVIIAEGRLATIPPGTGLMDTINWEEAFGGNLDAFLRSSALEHARSHYGTYHMLEYGRRVKRESSSGGSALKEIIPMVVFCKGSVALTVSHFFGSFRSDVASKEEMMVCSAPDYVPYVCTNPFMGNPKAGFRLTPTCLAAILGEAVTIRCAMDRFPYPGISGTQSADAHAILRIYEALREVFTEEELTDWLRNDPPYNELTKSNREDRDRWRDLVEEVKFTQQRMGGRRGRGRMGSDDEEEEEEEDDEFYLVDDGQELRAGIGKWGEVLRYLVPDMVSDPNTRKRQHRTAAVSGKGKGRARRS